LAPKGIIDGHATADEALLAAWSHVSDDEIMRCIDADIKGVRTAHRDIHTLRERLSGVRKWDENEVRKNGIERMRRVLDLRAAARLERKLVA